MIKTFFNNLANKFKNATPIMQGMIVLAVILIIGIILRWSHIVEQVTRSLDFLNGK